MISQAQLRVLAFLAKCHQQNGVCPDQNTLARAFGVTKQAISKHILALEELGYIEPRPPLAPKNAQRNLTPTPAGFEALRHVA